MLASSTSKLVQIAATMACLAQGQWADDLIGTLEASSSSSNDKGEVIVVDNWKDM